MTLDHNEEMEPMARLVREAEERLTDVKRTEELSMTDVMLALSGYETRRYDRIWMEGRDAWRSEMREALSEHEEVTRDAWYRKLAPYAIWAGLAAVFGAERLGRLP